MLCSLFGNPHHVALEQTLNLSHRRKVSATFLQWNKINIELHWKLCSLRKFPQYICSRSTKRRQLSCCNCLCKSAIRSGFLSASLFPTTCWWGSKWSSTIRLRMWLKVHSWTHHDGFMSHSTSLPKLPKTFRRLLVVHCCRLHPPKGESSARNLRSDEVTSPARHTDEDEGNSRDSVSDAITLY